MHRAVPVEVGAHGNHHLDAPVAVLRERHQRIQVLRPLMVIAAGREDLLELVDEQHRLLAALRQRSLERRQRMRAGAHQRLRPLFGPWEHAARERRQQARPHRRGLAAPGRTDHGEQGRTHEPRDQLGHKPLTPEEVLRVGGVEGGEPEEGADRRHRRTALLTSVEPIALVDGPKCE